MSKWFQIKKGEALKDGWYWQRMKNAYDPEPEIVHICNGIYIWGAENEECEDLHTWEWWGPLVVPE